jgi:7-carboxy-7-deazaguanine synthase
MIQVNSQPIEKSSFLSNGLSLDVHSIFYTIQGEGPFTGHPAVFVRLAGCNLQCPGCDTDYTSVRKEMSIAEILLEIEMSAYPVYLQRSRLIVITGGEPFRQNLTELTNLLLGQGFKVQVETNGTLAPSIGFSKDIIIVCSPKAGKINGKMLHRADCFKYVMASRSVAADGLPILALDHTASPCVGRPVGVLKPIYLQPMDEQNAALNALNLAAVKASCLKFGYILQLQIHKIIEVA